jgi:enamine deaminase RidA (YjgF/YER057c/UK114 family)
MASIEHPRVPGLLKTDSFSQVAMTSRTRSIFVSGQVSLDEDGKLVGGDDLARQTAQAMRNLGLALEAAGATYSDVVKTTTYVVNYKPEERDVIVSAKRPFWAGMTPPTSVLVGVSSLALPEWRIEIEAVAMLD